MYTGNAALCLEYAVTSVECVVCSSGTDRSDRREVAYDRVTTTAVGVLWHNVVYSMAHVILSRHTTTNFHGKARRVATGIKVVL